MKTITTLNDLIAEINKSGYFGLRSATQHDIDIINSGRDYLDCSVDMFAANDFVEYNSDCQMLNGTSAIGVSEYDSDNALLSKYNTVKTLYPYCNTILLLNDTNQEYGTDDGEVILGSNGYGANVIAVVNI